MINLAIIGYGKMGQRINELASEEGFRVIVVIDDEAGWVTSDFLLSQCEIALEFSTPATAPGNVSRLLGKGISVVSGTTGWHDKVGEMAKTALSCNAGLMVESNYSMGMNIFCALNRYLGNIMKDMIEYSVSLKEVHHIHKLDAPSGTAKKLVKDLDGILCGSDVVNETSCHGDNKFTIPVESVREGDVFGIHEVKWTGQQDKISIKHEAINRDGFVRGAFAAARWIRGKTGLHTMDEMLFGKD